MPTVEELRVSFDAASLAAGANAAAASVDKATAALDKFAASATTNDQVITRATKSLETVSRGLTGTAAEAARAEAANRKYVASIDAITAAEVKAGGATEETTQLRARAAAQLQQDLAKATQYGQSIEQRFLGAAKSTDLMAHASGNAAYAMRELGLQSFEAIGGIAAGGSIMQEVAARGRRLGDVMLTTGTGFSLFGQAARAAGGFLAGPGGLAVAAVAAGAAIYELGAIAESNSRRLLEMQTSLRGTRDDFAAMGAEAIAAGKAIAASSVFGRGDATAAAGAIANSANFKGTTEQLKQLVRVAGDVATVLGTTLPEEAKIFAEALNDPARVVQDFADKKLFGFNQALATSIENQARAGDKAGAFGRMIDQLSSKTANASEKALTPFQKSVHELELAFTGGGQAGEGLAEKLGKPIVEMATGFVKSITDMVTVIEKVIAAVNKMPPWVVAAGKISAQAVFNPSGLTAGAVNGAVTGVVNAGSGPSIWTEADTSAGLTANQRALLDVISGPESRGQYNVRYGGASGPQTFDTFATHPMVPERIPGTNQTSDAAGRYQFLSSTYQPIADQLGLTGFTPADQDRAAWQLAAQTYQRATGRDLNADLAAGRTGDIASALRGQWPSLPGGSQQLIGQTQFNQALTARLATPEQFGPPAPTSAETGKYGQANASATDGATKMATAAGTSVSAFQKAHAEADAYSKALADLAAHGQQNTDQFRMLTEALGKAQKAEYDAIGPAAAAVRVIDQQTESAKRIGAAYSGGFAAVAEVTIQTQAYQDALKIASPTAANFGDVVTALADAYRKLSAQQQDNQLSAKSLDNQQQLDYLRAETDTLGQTADQRARNLAMLKATQEIEKSQPQASAERKAAIVAEAGAIADANTRLQQMQNAWQELGNFVSQVGDQIASSISNAFVSGQGAAVTFGNITKAVMTLVINEVAKVALVNPILNAIGGGANRTTLGGVLDAVGGGSSGGGASALSMLSTGGSLVSGGSSLLQAFGYAGLGGQVNALLGGPGTSLLAGTGLGDVGAGILSTQLVAPTYVPLFAAGTEGASIGGVGGIGGTALGGATLGSALGGVGGGFALGSLSGSLIQSALGKTGPAPEIGAGIGAVGGAAAGALLLSEMGPAGVVIGGLIGGLLGGSGGAFIGPGRPNPYSGTAININNGLLGLGQSFSQGDPSSRPDAQLQTDTLNAFLTANGLSVTSLGDLRQIGQNTAGHADATKFANLGDAFDNLRFSSSDTHTNAFLTANGGAGFGTIDDLNAITGAIKSFVSATSGSDFASRIDTTLQNAEALGSSNVVGYLDNIATAVTSIDAIVANKNTGTLAKQVADLTAQFDGAAAAARQLGYKEAELATARDNAITAAVTATNEVFHQTDASLVGRYYTASAGVGDTGITSKFAGLYNFDLQADQQRKAYSDQLVAAYGDAYKTSAQYAEQMGYLERALGEERLATAKQYDDQMLQAAQSSVTSLATYARSLQASDLSPLAPTAQLTLARSQFNAVSGAAAAGDVTSITELQGYANSLLSASRAVNGSGVAYVADFNRVIDTLTKVAQVAPDTLTASVFQTESRTATETLSAGLAKLLGAVNDVAAQLRQSAATPVRNAA